MNAKATQALDRLAHEFGGDMLGEIATRDELLTAAFIELREEVAALRREQKDAPQRVSGEGGYVMLKEAAYRAGRSVEYMRKLAARGEVDAVFEHGRWWIRSDEKLR
jgi:hypothetical protein